MVVAAAAVLSYAGFGPFAANAATQQGGASPAVDAGANPVHASQRPASPRERRLAAIVSRMSADSGATIECDSSIASVLVAAPEEATTSANFETQIDALVTRLPKGTTWAKLYMPSVAAPARAYSPDALVEYAFAAVDLFGGRIGAALPPGTIEVLGRKLSAEKATAVASALDLKAVYIIVGSLARRNSVDAHVKAILAMRPEDRSAVLAQLSAPQETISESVMLIRALVASYDAQTSANDAARIPVGPESRGSAEPVP